MSTKKSTKRLPSEVLHDIFSENFADSWILIMSHNGDAELVQDGLTQKLASSDLRKLSQVSRQWRSIAHDLRVWQKVVIHHYDPITGNLNQSRMAKNVGKLQQLIDLADERERGLDVTLKVWSRRRNPAPFPALELLMSSTFGWRSFQFIATPDVNMGLTCYFMDIVRPKIEGIAMLGMVINDYDAVGRTETMQDLVERVESASLSLQYEEQAFQRAELELTDLELGNLESLSVWVHAQSVDLT
ncbi:hypothetical protein AAF712_015549, partial [Marasmius tenuissimus]